MSVVMVDIRVPTASFRCIISNIDDSPQRSLANLPCDGCIAAVWESTTRVYNALNLSVAMYIEYQG